MTIALFMQAIQALTGSQFVKDKLQRSEYVIRVLKAVGIDPEHPPEDFEAVYVYALVEYGYGKPDVCLEIFRAAEIRSGFRRSFDENNPQEWLTSGEAFLTSSEIGEKVRSSGCEASRELAEFAAAFLKVTRRSQTPKETLVQHQLRKIERTIDRKLERVAGQLEAIANPAALSPAETLTLIAASCRAGELALRMQSWFEVLGYHLEPTEKWDLDYFEWVINIPKRRGFDRVLVRGIAGEAKVHDVMGLRESVGLQRVDEGWLVTERRISKAARSACETPENADLFCFTFDEFLDQDADFEGYLDWLEAEILARGIESRYVPLACMKEEFDPMTHQRLGMSRYGESDGWTEGYIDLWLDDPAKEHLSILGEFGTGKTWLALHYASIAVSKYRSAKVNGVERPRLPIVIPLRDYAKAVSVESLFSEFFFRKHEIPIPGYSAFVELNRMGKLLLIFDGFDEMAARVDKQQMINNFWELAKVVVPGSKIILTCRTEHFPDAKEGRSLLNAELQASTRGLSGETPQFEVLELEKFDDSQIREVLLLASSSETVEQVMGNPQLLDLARRPVMTELILEALPDIEAGKPVDMSRVYLYAVRRKMERDIRAERTFTSMADKLYFLCELSWEMLSNDRMSLNYREFPDRIRKLFGSAVQEEKDLDHWHYDMMGQTMLIRNSDGDYQPAHRSLLEFFVAFKFAAELGALAPDFLELAQMKSGIDRTLEPRDYTWSEYFGGGAIAPLKGFVTESLEMLRSGFGKEILAKAVVDLLISMIPFNVSSADHPMLRSIKLTRGKDYNEVAFIGSNSMIILTKINNHALYDKDMSNLVFPSADFTVANLRGTNFSQSDLRNINFSKTSGGVFSATLSFDGRRIVTGDITGRIYVWDAETGKEIKVLKGHSQAIRALLFIPNTNQLISAAADNLIRIWEFDTWENIKTLQGHTNTVMSISLSFDNTRLASSSADQTIKIWEIESEKCLMTYEGHNGWIHAVDYNSDFNIIASGGQDKILRIWNSETGDCILEINKFKCGISDVSLSRDGNLLVSGAGEDDIRIWDVKTGRCLHILKGHFGRIHRVYFNNSGSTVISSSADRSIKFWNSQTGECIKTLLGHDAYWVHSICLSQSEELLVSASSREAKIWNVSTGVCVSDLSFRQTDINEIKYYPNGNIFASTSADTSIKLWDSMSGECIQVLNGHKKWTSVITFSPSGKLLASAGHDYKIRVWNVETGNCIRNLSGHTDSIYGLEFAKNDRYIISSGDDFNVNIWDVDDGELIMAMKDDCRIKSLSFNAQKNIIATGNIRNIIKLWDCHTGCLISGLSGHKDWVRSLQFSPCGNLLVSGSSDCLIIIWSVENNKYIHTLKGHTDWVNSVAFGHSEKLLVSGGFDCSVRLWNIDTRECLKIFIGHTTPVLSVAFSPDNTRILSSSVSGTIRIWDVLTGEQVAVIFDRPYEGMNITGVKGLSPETIATLKALGAVENEE